MRARVGLLIVLMLLVSQFAMAAEPIRVGVYEPMTGAMAAGGQMTVEGINLAHELYPEVLGRPIQLFLVDNRSDQVESANAVARLIEHNNVVAIIGTYGSSNAIAGSDVAERHGIPVLATSATNPMVTQGKDYSFRTCFIDPFQGEVMANYTFDNLGFSKAALMVDLAADYSVGLSNFFVRTFETLGGTIVSQMRYQTGDQEFTAQLTEIIARGAEVVFIPGYFGDAALIARQLRDLGSDMQILGGDALDAPELMSIGGQAVEGLSISSFFSVEAPQTEESKVFADAFQAKYGQLPNAMAALGYDSYMIIRDAIKRAGLDDPKAIRDALAATTDFPAVTGNTSLNEDGDAVKDAVILQVQDGAFRYLTTVKGK